MCASEWISSLSSYFVALLYSYCRTIAVYWAIDADRANPVLLLIGCLLMYVCACAYLPSNNKLLLAQLQWADDASKCSTFSCVNKCRLFAWAHEFGKLIGASSRGTRASMVRPRIDDRSKVDVGGDRDPRQECTRLSDRQSEIIQFDKDGHSHLSVQFSAVSKSLSAFSFASLSLTTVSLTGHWCDCVRANITTIFDKVGQRCQSLKT